MKAIREFIAAIGIAFGFGAGVAAVLVCAFALAGCGGPPEEPAKVIAAQHAAPLQLAETPAPPPLEPVAQLASAPATPAPLVMPMIPSFQADTRAYVLVPGLTMGDGSVKEVRQPGLTAQSCTSAANEWLAGRDWKAETGRSAECQVGS